MTAGFFHHLDRQQWPPGRVRGGLATLALATPAACASVPELAPGAMDLQVHRGRPEREGNSVGAVRAVHGKGCGFAGRRGDRQGALAQQRNEAATMKADYVVIERERARYSETDDQGGSAHNLDLSRRRAQAVRAWLVDAGIAPHRLQAEAYEDARPIASNDSEEGRTRNRRVQFTGDGAPRAVAIDSASGGSEPGVVRSLLGRTLGPLSPRSALPRTIGAYTIADEDAYLHEAGIRVQGLYRLANGSEVVAVVASTFTDRLDLKRVPNRLAGYPAVSHDDVHALFLSRRTMILFGSAPQTATTGIIRHSGPPAIQRRAERLATDILKGARKKSAARMR